MFYKELPEEIKVEIFSRLPAKSVGQCRTLSKRWQYLLSQSDFIKTHLNLTQHRYEHGLILDSYSPSAVFSASLSNAHHVFDQITINAKMLNLPHLSDGCEWVSNCCNGLVLLRDSDDNLSVVNPTTREVRELPLWPNASAFRDYCEYTKFGFGYDSVRDDYKVVVHVPSLDEDDYESDDDDDATIPETALYVYSLRNGGWKTSSFRDFTAHFPGGVYLNGHIHWLALWEGSRPTIMALDLENEISRKWDLPQCSSCDHPWQGSKLAVTNGALELRHEENNRWVMTEYGVQESWTNISFDFVEPEIKVLCSTGEGEIVLLIDEEELYLCVLNPESGERKHKEIVVHGVEGKYYTQGYYAETLVSPNNIAAIGIE